MRKFKKALAFALASAMIVSAVPASAAAKTNSAKGTKTTIYTYTVDKSKQGNGNNKKSWIKVTTKKGYTYKLVNKTKDIVSLTRTKVEAKKAGTAKINVKFYKNGKYVETKSVKITVKKAPMIGKVSLSKDTVNVGETATVSNAGKGTAYFYSSNKDVATVDKESGEIKALAGGTTTITAVNTITKARVKLTLTVVADAPVATQTGANTITITNGVAMDTEASKVKVTKGNASISVKETKVSEDKTSIVITTSSKLTDGTYTVALGDSKDRKLDVTAATEKVQEIKILSDKAAAINTDSDSAYEEASVNYKVYNQFQEDITETTTLNMSGTGIAGGATVNSGEVTFTAGDTGFIPNRDIVSLVLVHVESGVTAQATLTVSDEARLSTLTYEGVYNIDGKTLNENTDLDKDDFYALFTAQDQYGNELTEATINKDLYVTLAGGFTNLGAKTDNGKAKTVKKDNKEYIAIPLTYNDTNKKQLNMGTAVLTAVAAGSGKTVTENIEVGVGNTIDTFSVTVPGTVVKDEKVELEYSALDRSGNQITDYNALNRLDWTGKNGGSSDFKVELSKEAGNKGKFYFTYTGDVTNTATAVITFTTPTYKVSTAQITVKSSATPSKLEGVKGETISTTSGVKKEVKLGDLVVIDSYGRQVSSDDVAKILSGCSIELNIANASAAGIQVSGGAIGVNSTTPTASAIVGSSTAIDDKGDVLFDVTATGNKDAELVFKLTGKDGKVISQNVTVPVKVSSVSDVSGITATTGKLYAAKTATTEFAQEVTVKGKKNGVEVTLTPGTDYTLVPVSSYINKTGTNSIYVSADQKDISGITSGDLTAKVNVVLANGATQTVDVTVTATAPTVSEVEVNDNVKIATGGQIVVSGDAIVVSGGSQNGTYLVKSIKDSYGVKHTVDGVGANAQIAGMFLPTLDATQAQEIFNITPASPIPTLTVKDDATGKQGLLEVTYGGVTKVIKVTVE